MNALVIYDSRFGNTREVAHAIGAALAQRYEVRVIPVSEAAPLTAADIDLLVVGGPTHARGLSAGLRTLLDGVPRGSLRGVPAATFDTRATLPRWLPRWLSGSAARVAAKRLRTAGCELVSPPASFFVVANEGPLQPGELERAGAWARGLLASGGHRPVAV